ncbi:lasso peptide isopeptide bond-forming cyclase [Bacillus sp. UNC437CL72CviS29]|uniref:lasso peptide isopeptide bond-forming cyclase n=1 Tax=Bacillus sp. UNC437CL72CviS29 TaxID=1340430 RepID=UPI00047CB8C0|nr:lasso peptide isopeptide bond-forming cyclase [Bacillus sp. UNC437CL72CviS29]
MSAIAGIYHLNREPIPFEHSNGIMSALSRYPADSTNTWHKENIFLGAHMKWITPQSINEQLPYYDYEKQLVITADAIIDNRDELFDRLQVEQALRREMPDSKLILLAYQKWGENAPKYLIGDFAFMIWDERKRLLFGARDFSGSRTFYFFRNQNRFAFCTSIGPLFSLPYVGKDLNEQWLAEYLAIPNMLDTIDAFSTVHKNIEQVPPSHTISVVDGKVSISKYDVLFVGEKLHLKSNQEYEEAFRDVFESAVTSRLRTHRNVGSHLSGGLDSGAVASFAARALQKENKKLYTYSSVPAEGFIDWTRSHMVADEKPFIQSTVQHVGNITDHYLNFPGRNSFSEIDDWLDIMEMPYKFFENSIWVKGIYEKAQQQGVGVLLNGARGNFTISWGPALDYYAVLLKKFKWFQLYHEIDLYGKSIGVKKSRILKVVGQKAYPSINNMFSPQQQYELPTLVNPELAKRTDVFNKLEEHGVKVTGASIPNIYEIRQKHFEQLNLWNTTGTSGTKLSLRYGLQGHDPTNDLRVIRFCLSLPLEQFVQNGLNRALIRRSTKGLLPDKVRLNQRVRGIQAADVIHRMIPSWKMFIEELKQLSTDPVASNFFNMEIIKSAILKIQGEPQPENVFDPDFRILMRSLIVYRFIKKFI